VGFGRAATTAADAAAAAVAAAARAAAASAAAAAWGVATAPHGPDGRVRRLPVAAAAPELDMYGDDL
jgi:hypothetical protein